MRILLTSPTYPPFNSGLGNAVAQQAACLIGAGHEVVVATRGKNRGVREQGGVRIETFDLSGADSWLQPIRGEVSAYIDFLSSQHWDIVLLNAWQNWATDLALRNLDRIPGRKFVYSHCISTNVVFPQQPVRSLLRYFAWRPYWWRLSRLMKRLDGVLFLAKAGSDSRFDDLRLAQRLGVPFWIVPNSLSAEAVGCLDIAVKPFEARNRIIAVGSYHWQKGFDFVLRAYAASTVRNRLPLYLYGMAHTAYSNKLLTLVDKLGLTDCVVFCEGVFGDALIKEYSRARLVLSGSYTECQPLVLLDANATGTPFVARATGCIASMVGGVCVDSFQEMAVQIDALTVQTEIWESISDAGRQAAQQIYHPSCTTIALTSIFGQR